MGTGLGIDAAVWARISPLLEQALDVPPEQRDAWLDSLPLQDVGLKDTLRDLLARASGPETGALLATLPKVDADADAAMHAEGDVVGPYRLVRRLGVGGMGEVWLADRIDGLMQQRSVALKLPHGPFRGDLAARIAREREILAALDHPNIARLYDAGVAADRQPYLALEHVDGQRIDRYCEAQHLGVAARLRLFLQAARAVAYAHSQVVVHRDIKPSNLLVDAQGQVKLLDFGIAKILAEGERDAPELTQQGMRVLTPDYASPEQIAGLSVGTRSDVYSLGVLLFEMLTGTRPYRLKRNTRAELEEAILAAQVPPPSGVVVDPALRRALHGDIDTIVLKVLKKPVAERYASVDALVDDIERHLSDRPVLARPESVWYRGGKFIVRNRLAVGTAAALLLTACVGAGAALWQARIAIAERQRAEDVKDFVAGIFQEANPYEGIGKKDLSAVDLLKQADKRLGAALIGRSAARVELGNTIGASLLGLGDLADAEPIIARTVTEAEQTLAPDHHETVRALMLRSQVHRMRGRPQEASADADRILPTVRERIDADDDGPFDLVILLAHRAQLAMDLGAHGEGEKFAQECVAVAQSRLGEREPERVACAMLLALAYRHAGKFDQALASGERAYRQALAVFGDRAPHRRTIEARVIFGRALADTGKLARGLAELDAAVADSRTLLGPSTQATGIYLQNMVAYRIDLGELDAAAANAAEALAILGDSMGRNAPTYAVAEHSQALVHLARRNAPAALAGATRAAEVLDRVQGSSHENAIAARTTMALALMDEGRLDDAAREVEAVVPRAEALAPASLQRARVTLARGTLARLRGDPSMAMQWLQPLADASDPPPKWQRERMRAWVQIGWVQLEQGALDGAVASFERALKEFERLETRPTPVRADAQFGLGRARLALGDRAQALALIDQADAFWRGFDPSNRHAAAAAQALSLARARPQE